MLNPADLVLLDTDKSAPRITVLGLTGRTLLVDDSTMLCVIRDPSPVREVFEKRRAEVVFHAAALKHVPVLERFPRRGVYDERAGHQSALDTAAAVGVERFINTSGSSTSAPTRPPTPLLSWFSPSA